MLSEIVVGVVLLSSFVVQPSFDAQSLAYYDDISIFKDADLETLKTVNVDLPVNSEGFTYAIDKYHVYDGGIPVAGSDPDSFDVFPDTFFIAAERERVPRGYAIDNNFVYLISCYEACEIEGVVERIGNFIVIDEMLWRNGLHYYDWGKFLYSEYPFSFELDGLLK